MIKRTFLGSAGRVFMISSLSAIPAMAQTVEERLAKAEAALGAAQ